MPLKANETIIEWDGESGQSLIANPGETFECGDALAASLIASKRAVAVDAVEPEPEPEPEGVTDGPPPSGKSRPKLSPKAK